MFGPHPDDFDVSGVTLRRFAAADAEIHLAVMTTGASGVDEADYPGLDRAARARLRESEQAQSCAFFGLSPEHVRFLRLDLNEGGFKDDAVGASVVDDLLRRWNPDLVFLPHPDDPNAAHQCTFALVRRCLEVRQQPATMYLNRDPKTIAMRTDLLVLFGEHDAEWKRRLLANHVSQQRRNQRTRGSGLDDRILDLNAAAAAEAGRDGYAEAFELRRYPEGVSP